MASDAAKGTTAKRKYLKLAAAGVLGSALLTMGAVGAVGAAGADDDPSKSQTTTTTTTTPPTTTVTAASGTVYTLTLKTLDNARGYVYCELVFDYGAAGQDIFSTSPIAPCDSAWWDSLDLDAVAAELGANFVFKNGPQDWTSDVVAVMASDPVTIAGVEMNFGAILPPGTVGGGGGGTPQYGLFNTAKSQNLTWNKGKDTFQLVDGNGYHYILQGNKIPTSELPTLGDQFQNLPEGWSYEVITYKKDLVVDLSPAGLIPSVQDEFDQIYILIPTEATLATGKPQQANPPDDDDDHPGSG